MRTLSLLIVFLTLSQLVKCQNIFEPIRARIAPSNSRIIGGDEVEPHSLPYQVALHINNDAYCGGALISENYVLTAAHCGVVIDTVDVILGAHNLSNPDEETQIRIKGQEPIIFEKFDEETLHHDIALIKLSEPAPLNDAIQIVPLCSSDDSGTTHLDEVATASGWGLYQDVPFPLTTDMSDVLLKVDVTISNLTECSDFYNIQEENEEKVYETNICTSGHGNKGTCNGDSGGPLTIAGVLIGVTSFGTDKCERCSPSVYTRVVYYLDWIADNSDVKIQ